MSFSASVEELVEASSSQLICAAPSWRRIPLGYVADILNGYPWKSAQFNEENGVPVIRIRDVTPGKTETLYRGKIEDGYWVEDGDLLIGMDGDFHSRIWAGGKALLNQRVCRITPNERLYLKDFLAQVLPGYLELINGETHSVTVKHLSSKTLAEIPLPLPPLPEQRRIVAKIDSLSTKSKRTRDQLDHVPRLVEKYKRIILASAFKGDLTRHWRANRPVPWTETTIGEIAHVASGHTPKGIERALEPNGDISWFKVSSMNEAHNQQHLTSSQFRLPHQSAQQLGLRIFPAGTIAFPKRGGAIATNKKRRLGVDAALDLNLMALVPRAVQPNFLWWWMQGLDLASISNGSNVPQINHGDVEPLPISLPNDDEQDEIAQRVSRAFSWIERLASEATSARKLIDHLDQAILAKAFQGKLVPQDPGDEPASVLLQRIRAERVTAPATQRHRNGKRADVEAIAQLKGRGRRTPVRHSDPAT